MTDFLGLFDSYVRQARLYPALISLFPAVLTAIAWHPDLLTASWTTALATLATTCGLTYALGVFARSQGKIAEKDLLNRWGGWPTTIWLRHRETHLPQQARARYHKFLTEKCPDLTLPTEEDEKADPERADESYAAGVKWLQEQCRNEKAVLVDKENAEYGFRRNLYGLKGFAVGLSALSCLLSVTAIVSIYGFPVGLPAIRQLPSWIIAASAIDALAAVAIWRLVNPKWVRESGDQYARALLAYCDRPADQSK